MQNTKKVLKYNSLTSLALVLAACGSRETSELQNFNDINGTLFTDILRGTDGSDRISGYAGNDQLYGYDGDDYLLPGTGQDRVYGGNGSDTIYIEDIGQIVDGGAGNNLLVITGRLQTVPITINLTSEILASKTGNFSNSSAVLKNISNIDASAVREIEIISSNNYNNIITGDGNDIISDIGLQDEIYSNYGDDRLIISNIPSKLDTGFGIDTLQLMGNIFENLEVNIEQDYITDLSSGHTGTINNIEVFELSLASQVSFNGSSMNEVITTGDGDDFIHSKGGIDIISTGSGSDTIVLTKYENGSPIITDFNIGDNGDVLLISDDVVSLIDAPELIFIDTQISGKKLLNLDNQIAIFTAEGGYTSVDQLRLSLNSVSGVASTTEQTDNKGFIGLWYNRTNDWVEVSLIEKQNSASNISETVFNLAILQNLDTNALETISDQNFLVA